MASCGNKIGVPCGTNSSCPDGSGCPGDRCPDFTLKRHDTHPAFKVAVSDCDGPLDLTSEDLSVSVSIWGNAKLKAAIDDADTEIAFADNIGFDQLMVGDIIIMDRVRLPEQMLVKAFDEDAKLIEVERGYNSTTASAWVKGAKLKFFRAIDAAGVIETTVEDVEQLDGTVLKDQVIDSFLVYEWAAVDTCTPGCFWLQFKLIKAQVESIKAQGFTDDTFTPDDFGCALPDGTEWIRRFPESSDGFLIKINNATI